MTFEEIYGEAVELYDRLQSIRDHVLEMNDEDDEDIGILPEMAEAGETTMELSEIIHDILKRKRMTFRQYAKNSGVSKKALSKRIRFHSLCTSLLAQMMDSLGYKVVIVPWTEYLSEDGYEVE